MSIKLLLTGKLIRMIYLKIFKNRNGKRTKIAFDFDLQTALLQKGIKANQKGYKIIFQITNEILIFETNGGISEPPVELFGGTPAPPNSALGNCGFSNCGCLEMAF